jgi:type I restriction enzyme R subunit
VEKRNQEEEAIAELIRSFEEKIEAFFNHIPTTDLGKRFIAKMTDDGNAFSADQIYHDFTVIYKRYMVVNKDLGEFFKKETKDSLNQLCDDFERSLKQTAV